MCSCDRTSLLDISGHTFHRSTQDCIHMNLKYSRHFSKSALKQMCIFLLPSCGWQAPFTHLHFSLQSFPKCCSSQGRSHFRFFQPGVQKHCPVSGEHFAPFSQSHFWPHSSPNVPSGHISSQCMPLYPAAQMHSPVTGEHFALFLHSQVKSQFFPYLRNVQGLLHWPLLHPGLQ